MASGKLLPVANNTHGLEPSTGQPSWLIFIAVSTRVGPDKRATTNTFAEPNFADPSVAVAVTVTDPDAFAVTFPDASTYAMAGLLDAHETARLEAFDGNTVAVSETVFPASTTTDLGVTATDDTQIGVAANQSVMKSQKFRLP